MASNVKAVWEILKAAIAAWIRDKAPRLGAALSYYTVFALPPLFIIVLFIASLWLNESSVRSQLFHEVGGLIGQKSAAAIETAMTSQYFKDKGALASAIAVVTLLATATGLFIELQDALNTIWGVEEKANQGILSFIKNRLLSFAMLVGIGFLLLVSLVISAALAAFGKYVSGLMPGIQVVWIVLNTIFSFAVVTVLFAMIFKVLPDVKIAWRDVWVGAITTAFLFTLGKFLLGWYLGRSSIVSAYGAAGSIVLILLWVYYSAQILFFGAELTQAYANHFGVRLEPSENARWQSGIKTEAHAARNRRQRLVAELKEEVDTLRHVVMADKD